MENTLTGAISERTAEAANAAQSDFNNAVQTLATMKGLGTEEAAEMINAGFLLGGTTLEEWPTASWDGKGVTVGPIATGSIKAINLDPAAENQKNAEIKALRLRSKSKGEKNAFLSLENAELKKHIKEIKLQKTRLMDDVGDYTKENRRLVDEVNKGNEYRAKMKETVESLHAQIRAAKENEKAATSAAVQTEIELERYKRITDALLDKGPF